MSNEEINQYYEYLSTLPGINSRNYIVSGNYSEIEVECGNKYYIYNVERETYLGPFGKRLFDYCKPGVTEEALTSDLIASYPNRSRGEITRYIYVTLKKLKKEGFII